MELHLFIDICYMFCCSMIVQVLLHQLGMTLNARKDLVEEDVTKFGVIIKGNLFNRFVVVNIGSYPVQELVILLEVPLDRLDRFLAPLHRTRASLNNVVAAQLKEILLWCLWLACTLLCRLIECRWKRMIVKRSIIFLIIFITWNIDQFLPVNALAGVIVEREDVELYIPSPFT
jgi:hypothetical protein